MQVVNSDDGGGIIERSDAKFEIFQIAGCVPWPRVVKSVPKGPIFFPEIALP